MPEFITGKSIKDILKMKPEDFSKISLSDFRKTVSRLVSAGNKRVRRFIASGERLSPAANKVREEGLFSVKGKDFNGLMKEFSRAKQYLESPESTLRDWRRERVKIQKELDKKGVTLSSEDLDEINDMYNELDVLGGTELYKKYRGKNQILVAIENTRAYDAEGIKTKLREEIEAAKRQQEALEEEYEGVSDFFEF